MDAEVKPHCNDDTLLHLPFASYIALPIHTHYAAWNGWEALLRARFCHRRSGHFAKQAREVPHQTAGELLMYFEIAIAERSFFHSDLYFTQSPSYLSDYIFASPHNLNNIITLRH